MLFKSKYLALAVNCDGKTLQFKNGEFDTTDKTEIKTLKKINDVKEFVEVKEETKEK